MNQKRRKAPNTWLLQVDGRPKKEGGGGEVFSSLWQAKREKKGKGGEKKTPIWGSKRVGEKRSVARTVWAASSWEKKRRGRKRSP